jgi:hypothetical protein
MGIECFKFPSEILLYFLRFSELKLTKYKWFNENENSGNSCGTKVASM